MVAGVSMSSQSLRLLPRTPGGLLKAVTHTDAADSADSLCTN